jgi:prophage regulatory protein
MSIEHSPSPRAGRRLLRRKEVLNRLGIGSSTLHDWIRRGYFPKPIQLGPNTVGWLDTTVDELLTARERAANGSR